MGAGLSRERRRLSAAALRSSSALLQPGGAQACLSTAAGQSWGGQPLGRAASSQPLASGSLAFALPAFTRGFAASAGGSGPGRVNEAAVRRLVQHSREVTERHGRSQRLAAEEVAARVRLLLADGCTEAQVGVAIERSNGGPYCDVEEAAQTLGLLRRLGLTKEQRGGCVATAPSFLTCSPDQVAAVMQLLRAELGASKQQLARLVCRAPQLLSLLPETLAAKLAWWQGQACSESTRRALLASLRQNPGVLKNVVQSVRSKLALLQAELGASDEAMARKLPAAVLLLNRDVERTVLPRIDFLLGLLGDTEMVLRRVLNYLTVLARDEGSMLATLATLEGRMGSRDDALGVLRRCLQLFCIGTELGRNFDALAGVVGSVEAARSIVRKDALVLTRDLSHPTPAARIAFWCRQLGLAPDELVLAHPSLPLRRLDTVAPRWAWVQRHRADHSLGTKYVQERDADCMARYGVPLEGFAEFKAAWLASEEGRAVCRHEREVAGGATKVGGESEGEEEEVGS